MGPMPGSVGPALPVSTLPAAAAGPARARAERLLSFALPYAPMRCLLITPPMVQLNTPYPATAYLTGFLRGHAADLGLEVTQADASLSLFLRLFSAPLVARMAHELRRRAQILGKKIPVPPS